MEERIRQRVPVQEKYVDGLHHRRVTASPLTLLPLPVACDCGGVCSQLGPCLVVSARSLSQPRRHCMVCICFAELCAFSQPGILTTGRTSTKSKCWKLPA